MVNKMYICTMRLELLAAEVQEVFDQLDASITEFKQATTLHCKAGCWKCCHKADIEATPLEFLPLAMHLYKQGLAEEWLLRLESDSSPYCTVLSPGSLASGKCSEYPHRGLICRLFGYSARKNKHGRKELVTCTIIKTEQTEPYQKAQEEIDGGFPVPVMSHYYTRLVNLDASLAGELLPINAAIRKAIETVLQYYSYQKLAEP